MFRDFFELKSELQAKGETFTPETLQFLSYDDLIRAAIDAEPQAIRARLVQPVRPDDFARPDRAGGWIVPLGEERHIIGSA